MKHIGKCYALLISLSALALCSCSTTRVNDMSYPSQATVAAKPDVTGRLPQKIATSEKTVVIDPRVHAWGAYDSSGNLIRSGLASAGASYCPDIKRPCRTSVGSFRVKSLGSADCKSTLYPLPKGGAPMPYCMFFNGNQGMHGSPSSAVVDGNVSHGCVRMQVADAEWLRFNFVNVGTKVIVRPY